MRLEVAMAHNSKFDQYPGFCKSPEQLDCLQHSDETFVASGSSVFCLSLLELSPLYFNDCDICDL